MSEEFPPTESSDPSPPEAGLEPTDLIPTHIGRFQIEKIIGKGGFGVVYLGYDEQLQRKVAIKVPKPQFVQRAEDRDLHLKEARTVAGLEHPNIVPVLEVGSSPEFPIYIVSKFIVGKDLAAHLKAKTPTSNQAVVWMIDLADALREAHRKGFVHRDVKPQNILVDQDERVYLVDFGLALADQDVGKRLPAGGTPAYMSPEQARGEGHRVDGRSDLFSLGILFYEMLSGRRPFQGNSHTELFEQITDFDPKPLRQWDESVPVELERICLKMLAKRKSERYSNARDLADDLKVFLTKSRLDSIPNPLVKRPSSNETERSSADATPAATPTSDSRTLKIVPKGLRSFDHRDADFFLELLPGARDRDGLPESVRFWKSRIEERDAEQMFAVGLVYGPSGCGKSSMMKAGLLPRLTPDIVPIYLEASVDDTERTLLALIRKRLESKEAETTKSLVDLLQEIRRGRLLSRGKKLLIVIDQFEQWLFAHPNAAKEPLLESLLQCDGSRVQAIVMVRDDFWMAATRFFRDLDIRLVEGTNSAAVDLFDFDHAERVLRAFGQAFGKLETSGKEDKQDRKQFITEAVRGLSEDGKVISVRLSLFAEMMKSRPWTHESLKEVGGTSGVGVVFLDGTFSAKGAPPEHRFHQAAARKVLRSLLPDSGMEIKGHKRSSEELLAVSGYENRPRDFADLMRILDSELRLITPLDKSGDESNQPSNFFQLTHDYLVSSLRDWLTRKQRETWRGRAELKLAERAAAWTAKRESQQLPSFIEWLGISRLTDRKQWTDSERRMMRKARLVHLGSLIFVPLIVTLGQLLLIGLPILLTYNSGIKMAEQELNEGRALLLVNQVLEAGQDDILQSLARLEPNLYGAQEKLQEIAARQSLDRADKATLNARLALVIGGDKTYVQPLLESLLTGTAGYVEVIRGVMEPHKDAVVDQLWDELNSNAPDDESLKRRFRAGIALANFSPDSGQWDENQYAFMADRILRENPVDQAIYLRQVGPIAKQFIPKWKTLFIGDDPFVQGSAAYALEHFAQDGLLPQEEIVQLLTQANPKQFQILFPLIQNLADQKLISQLQHVAATPPSEETLTFERVIVGRTRASAGIALLRLGEMQRALDMFRLESDLKRTDGAIDPEALSQFVHRCRERGITAEDIAQCLDRLDSSAALVPTSKDAARYALLLALAEFPVAEVEPKLLEKLVAQAADWYRNDPSSSVHGAIRWLLLSWNRKDVINRVDQTDIPYAPGREWFVREIPLPNAGESTYMTFVVFQPGEFSIGSPDDEPFRGASETTHLVRITRPYAIADREITGHEIKVFSALHGISLKLFPGTDSHGGPGLNWYESVRFCRWLSELDGLSEKDQAYPAPDAPELQGMKTVPGIEPKIPSDWPLHLERRGYRLATEDEWEVAARAGVRTQYFYGGDRELLTKYAWLALNSGNGSAETRTLRPNLRGLFDMHGNMFEWVHNWFGPYPSDEPLDWAGPATGERRVIRGGCYGNIQQFCRNSARGSMVPTTDQPFFGFRVTMTLPTER